MDEAERAKLEKELQFLKESFEGDLISQEEFEVASKRIEGILKEEADLQRKEEEGETPAEETPGKEVPAQKDSTEESDEDQAEKSPPGATTLSPPGATAEAEPQEETNAEAEEEIKKDESTSDEPEEKIGETAEEEKAEAKEKKPRKKKAKSKEESPEEEKVEAEDKIFERPVAEKKPGTWRWIVGVIIIVLALFYFFSISGDDSADDKKIEEQKIVETAVPECSADFGCVSAGKIGICENAGTAEASCTFSDDALVRVTVLNKKGCSICSTSRMKDALGQVFPNIAFNEVDADSTEGKRLTGMASVVALPSYFIDKNAEKASNFGSFKSALVELKDTYLLTTRSSGANYYFKRPEKKDEFVLLVKEGDAASEKAKSTMKQLTELFGSKITVSVLKADDALVKELDINSFPTVLINNRYKFGGVRAANDYKEMFCEYNKLDECSKELGKGLD